MTITSSSCGFDGATTLSIMTFSIMTLSKLPLFSLGGPGNPSPSRSGVTFTNIFGAKADLLLHK